MVEVFKTNVIQQTHANMLVDQIQRTFLNYKANFDLEDCDNILRVKNITGVVQTTKIIQLVETYGFEAEVLPDEVPISR